MCPGLGVGQQDLVLEPKSRCGVENRWEPGAGRGTEDPEHETGGQRGVVALSTLRWDRSPSLPVPYLQAL